jgi:short-subunit dehydrogenase
MKQLHDKIIWITGASSGIGEALAYGLAQHGARLVLTARRKEKLQQIADNILQQHKLTTLILPADVTDLDALESAAQEMQAAVGLPDIVIANAGSHIFSKPLQFNAREYRAIMDLNFGGMLNTFHVVLPAMLDRGSGHLVGMASLAGYRGLPRAAAYGASKAAMIHFLESIYFHLEPKNITVSTVNPGFVKTPLTDKNDFQMPFLMSPEAAARTIIEGIRREKRVIAFPFLFSSILALLRIIPFPIYKFLVKTIAWPQGDEEDLQQKERISQD